MQLSEWLKARELTQEAFAKIVGVTQGRIAQVLQGDMPSMALAARIYEATGGDVTPNDFANITPASPPPAPATAERATS